MANKTFNIYCDESCHIENDHKLYMFLGSISSPYHEVKLHSESIKDLKKRHNFYAEIKWTGVSKSKIHFYESLIDYFFATDLQFRVIGVEKAKIITDTCYDDFYYQMYYYLLNHNINTLYNYNVYLDIKDTLSANKINKLKEVLNAKYGVFRNVQSVRSNESILMQLTDFMMGAISYLHNDKNKLNLTKIHLIDMIKQKSNDDLLGNNLSKKLNRLFIELK